MASPHNVEFEAAKFLQKLIHESTDEPSKLATKLYVILQHMKASGKENSMPYQVISRAMETVINQHGLDIDALMSSRIPMSGGSHSEESGRVQGAGCSQSVGAATDSKLGLTETDASRTDGFALGRPPSVPSSLGHDPFKGSVPQRSTVSFDHESPSSMDTRSTNSHSQDRRETTGWEQQGQKDSKRVSTKRKRSDSSASEPQNDSAHLLDGHSGMPNMMKERFTSKAEMPGAFPGSPSSDPFPGKGLADSEHWKQGFLQGAAQNFRERPGPPQSLSSSQGDVSITNVNAASRLDAANASQVTHNADGFIPGCSAGNLSEMSMLRSATPRDMGKSAANVASMPFKEHHLKQLRAQCLVFLAFRNLVPPKRLHLEIALGNMLQKEGPSGSVDGTQNEMFADKGKQQTTMECSSISEVNFQQGNLANVSNNEKVPASAVRAPEIDPFAKETFNDKVIRDRPGPLSDPSRIDEEKKHFSSGRGILEAETQGQETSNSSAFVATSSQPVAHHGHDDKLQPVGTHQSTGVLGLNKHLKPEMIGWTGVAHTDSSRGPLPSTIQDDLGTRKDCSPFPSQQYSGSQIFQHADGHLPVPQKTFQGIETEHQRVMPGNDSNLLRRNASTGDNVMLENQGRSNSDASIVHAPDTSYKHKSFSPLAHVDRSSEVEVEDMSQSAGFSPSPRYTLSERWIMAHQKRKAVAEQKWVQKLQKADQRIVACFIDLKETVSSSEDISAKTRSVIELKKLQLLELQRRLRRNIMNDFFKPVQTEMDRLKSIKKHRIGRRLKHVEKYEQKMKEERQKRIRERQKEFFSEIEVHKERLEDMFKFKRERCKGFNRYVKEFHKRKERIHREKIDRIQREKINLLKINDVEGYLRMVQDAKSDRVNKLLKETEKYLLKLGSRLKEAKSTARQAEMDENHIVTVDESSELAFDVVDETDQAKHYKESNEKYYMIAHSIKESIAEQPTGLIGGKLREYQMNGLRWLVSLYNNHLNGILADEMGLGKTVQVISLICYLMEKKNDRGPFLVVVPSSVLPGWAQEMNFWAPGINKIVYAGPPEERRKLFKESIVHTKFNVLLTTYEYLMNKHDRPKLSKVQWHYVIIDEGHRIKNASCKLNADLKHYHSSHRLLLTGTPLQNNLEELWALLNFLLPNIFNSSEDFSQWFNKPFEGNGDNSPDEALLSEEENLLIINRLHQVLRPFVLRRLKHKVENQLPEKIERLVRCEASAYQKLLMKRVEENLGALGATKTRAVHNSVVELRNICNHPYLSQLHSEEVDGFIPKHFLPSIIRLCGKLEMLDRLLPKLQAANHRILFFSTMTRLLDVMEDYLVWKQYSYLRLDGHTSGQDRGALIDKFNQPGSPYFIFLLSIRAGGVGVNLQAADTVIIFDTDWNPQVDLQAQARAHRIGQKKDVLVLRLETVHSVEEQVRAAAEHKLGVANQSITAGFFDNNTSAEDRREYLESLLRECKKEEDAPVLDDDGLNDILARSESEIDIFEAVDQKRREDEMAIWKTLVIEQGGSSSEDVPPLPSRLVTEDDLKAFYEAMKVYEVSGSDAGSEAGLKRKGGSLGGFDTQHYGRGKRAREVRSYEEQWTEEEFEKMCQADSPETAKSKEQVDALLPLSRSQTSDIVVPPSQTPPQVISPLEPSSFVKKVATPPVKRGRGRPRRTPINASAVHSTPIGASKSELQKGTTFGAMYQTGLDSHGSPPATKDPITDGHHVAVGVSPNTPVVSSMSPPPNPGAQATPASSSMPTDSKQEGRKAQLGEDIPGRPGIETVRRRGRKPGRTLSSAPGSVTQDSKPSSQTVKHPSPGTSTSVPTTLTKVTDDSVGECVGATSTKSLDGPADLAVDASKASETPVNQDSVILPGTQETCTTGQNACVLESAAISVSDPKPDELSFKQVLLDVSSVDATPPASSDVSSADITPISKASVESSATLAVGKNSPPRVRPELHTVAPDSAVIGSESTPTGSTGRRPGKRQSQMALAGIEPVRRRGRKRGQTISSVPVSSSVPDADTNKPINNSASGSAPMVTNITTPSKSANQGMASHVATVPVDPIVPVSGFMSGSTAAVGTCGSLNQMSAGSVTSESVLHPSGSHDIPCETSQMPTPLQAQGRSGKGQVGEMASRGRGRKRTRVPPASLDNMNGQDSLSKHSDGKTEEVVGRKVIATRSRQMNSSQPKNAQGVGRSDTSVMRASKDLKSTISSSSVGIPKDTTVVAGPSVEGSSLRLDDSSKSLKVRHSTSTEEAKLCRPADLPPISRSGKTNVIVLALEPTASGVHPSGINSGKIPALEECPTLKPSAHNSGAQVSPSTVTVPIEEEMSAPPGFDTPRPCLAKAVTTKPQKSNSVISKIVDAKISPVVLALESTAQNVYPSASGRNISGKEESYVLQTKKKSPQGKLLLSKQECSEAGYASADAMVTIHPEEISAPPGFDVPQHPVSEIAVAEPLGCEDDQVKQDILVAHNAKPERTCDVVGGKNELSREPLLPSGINVTAASSSGFGINQSSQIEPRNVHDSLPMAGSVSGDTVAESNEDSSVPPGFGSSKAHLMDAKNNLSCDIRDTKIPNRPVPSGHGSDSDSHCLEEIANDDMQATKTGHTADIPIAESGNISIAATDQIMQKNDAPCADRDLVLQHEETSGFKASMSKIDIRKGQMETASRETDHQIPTIWNETCSGDGLNLKGPSASSSIVSTSFDSQTVEKTQSGELSASQPGDSDNIKLIAISTTSTENMRCAKEIKEIVDACQDDSACETGADSQILGEQKVQMDVAISTAHCLTNPSSYSNVAKQTQQENTSASGSGDDDHQIANSDVISDKHAVSVFTSKADGMPEACDGGNSEHGAGNVSDTQAATTLESLEIADSHVANSVDCKDVHVEEDKLVVHVEEDKLVSCDALNGSVGMAGIDSETKKLFNDNSKPSPDIQKKEASSPDNDSISNPMEACGVGPSVSKSFAGNSEVEIASVVNSPFINTTSDNADLEDDNNLKETSPMGNSNSHIIGNVEDPHAKQCHAFHSVSEPGDHEEKGLIASPNLSIGSKENIKLDDAFPGGDTCEIHTDSHAVCSATMQTDAADIITQSPTLLASSENEAEKKTEPESSCALATVLNCGEDDNIKFGSTFVSSSEDLKDPKLHTESEVAGLNTNETCRMEIDSGIVTAEIAQPMDDSTVLVPEACQEDRICSTLSAEKEEDCGQTVTNVRAVSGTISPERREENTSPKISNDVDVSQTASCLVASETQAISHFTSEFEELPEGTVSPEEREGIASPEENNDIDVHQNASGLVASDIQAASAFTSKIKEIPEGTVSTEGREEKPLPEKNNENDNDVIQTGSCLVASDIQAASVSTCKVEVMPEGRVSSNWQEEKASPEKSNDDDGSQTASGLVASDIQATSVFTLKVEEWPEGAVSSEGWERIPSPDKNNDADVSQTASGLVASENQAASVFTCKVQGMPEDTISSEWQEEKASRVKNNDTEDSQTASGLVASDIQSASVLACKVEERPEGSTSSEWEKEKGFPEKNNDADVSETASGLVASEIQAASVITSKVGEMSESVVSSEGLEGKPPPEKNNVGDVSKTASGLVASDIQSGVVITSKVVEMSEDTVSSEGLEEKPSPEKNNEVDFSHTASDLVATTDIQGASVLTSKIEEMPECTIFSEGQEEKASPERNNDVDVCQTASVFTSKVEEMHEMTVSSEEGKEKALPEKSCDAGVSQIASGFVASDIQSSSILPSKVEEIPEATVSLEVLERKASPVNDNDVDVHQSAGGLVVSDVQAASVFPSKVVVVREVTASSEVQEEKTSPGKNSDVGVSQTAACLVASDIQNASVITSKVEEMPEVALSSEVREEKASPLNTNDDVSQAACLVAPDTHDASVFTPEVKEMAEVTLSTEVQEEKALPINTIDVDVSQTACLVASDIKDASVFTSTFEEMAEVTLSSEVREPLNTNEVDFSRTPDLVPSDIQAPSVITSNFKEVPEGCDYGSSELASGSAHTDSSPVPSATQAASTLESREIVDFHGNKGVLENTLTELSEQIEENATVGNDDQKCCSHNPLGLNDGMDDAGSFQHLASQNVETDASILDTKVADLGKPEEDVIVDDVDQKYGKAQSIDDGGKDASIISQPEITKESVSYPSNLAMVVEDSKHDAEESVGTLHDGVKQDGRCISESSDACKDESMSVPNMVDNTRASALEDEKIRDIEDVALDDDGSPVRPQIVCDLEKKAETAEVEACDTGNMQSAASSENDCSLDVPQVMNAVGPKPDDDGKAKINDSSIDLPQVLNAVGSKPDDDSEAKTNDSSIDLPQVMNAVGPKPDDDSQAKTELTGSAPGSVEQSVVLVGGNAEGGIDNAKKGVEISTDNAGVEETTCATAAVESSVVQLDSSKPNEKDSSCEKS